MKLKTQIMNSNLELEDELRFSVDTIVEDSETSIQESREKLKVVEEEVEEVWKNGEKSEKSENIKVEKTRVDL